MTDNNTAAQDAKAESDRKVAEYMALSEELYGGHEGFSEEEEVELAEIRRLERLSLDTAAANLEKRYADRGLKFNSGFRGSVPVQAFGTIDGMMFYFRYRGDYGSLQVGFVEEGRYELEYERDMLFHNERVKKRAEDKAAAGDSWDTENEWFDDLLFAEPKLEELTDTSLPTTLRKVAAVADYLDEPYNGTLTGEQCEDLFIRLVGGLEDIDWVRPIIAPEIAAEYGLQSNMQPLTEG